MVMYLACDTVMENHLTSLDSTFFFKLMPENQGHSGRFTGPRSAVGNVPGYRCVSDCISRGREFDPGPVPYFRGD